MERHTWYNQLHSITESTVRKIHKSYSFTMQYLSRLCRTCLLPLLIKYACYSIIML